MKVAVLTGSESSERSVALASSKNVVEALSKKHQVDIYDFPTDLDKFLNNYKNYNAAVPVFHGPGGEDGKIQGFLNTLKVPFIFSDVEAHAVAMDKGLSKFIAEKIGLLTSAYKIIYNYQDLDFTKPVVVKPLVGGSSIGISIVHDKNSLDKALKNAFNYSDKVLIEDYIEGKELTVAVIDQNDETIALPVIEVRSKNNFFDYESKYDATLAEEICPAPISEKLAKELQSQAIKIHQAIGIRHISRTDFIVSDNKIYFLEVNTIPGMTNESLLPKAIKAANKDFGHLLDMWLNSVIK
ncbi:D-alanine--D-alanine ligase [Patescibacteria group bacterium]|nr:D-alanine--D-alanine ligase [Patescibacteria group bacterium]